MCSVKLSEKFPHLWSCFAESLLFHMITASLSCYCLNATVYATELFSFQIPAYSILPLSTNARSLPEAEDDQKTSHTVEHRVSGGPSAHLRPVDRQGHRLDARARHDAGRHQRVDDQARARPGRAALPAQLQGLEGGALLSLKPLLWKLRLSKVEKACVKCSFCRMPSGTRCPSTGTGSPRCRRTASRVCGRWTPRCRPRAWPTWAWACWATAASRRRPQPRWPRRRRPARDAPKPCPTTPSCRRHPVWLCAATTWRPRPWTCSNGQGGRSHILM